MDTFYEDIPPFTVFDEPTHARQLKAQVAGLPD